MLVACGTSQVNRSWSAGTTLPAWSTSHALMATFTALSAAPLDCGSPSTNVSYTISPVQANSTGLSEESIEGSLSHRKTLKFSKSFTTIFKHFLAAWEIHSFGRNQVSKNRPSTPSSPSTVHHQNGTVSALFNLHLTDPISGSKETTIPRQNWDLLAVLSFLAALRLASLGSTSPLHKGHTQRSKACTPCQHVIRRAAPASRFSNFIATDGFNITRAPLSHLVSEVWNPPYTWQAHLALLVLPLMPRPQDSKCPAGQLYPTFVLSAVSRVVQASLARCSAPFEGPSAN